MRVAKNVGRVQPLSDETGQPNTMNITGKTIAKATKMKLPQYDDTGWLKLEFTDGTSCVIVAGYGEWTSESEDEYPTRIHIAENIENLVPA